MGNVYILIVIVHIIECLILYKILNDRIKRAEREWKMVLYGMYIDLVDKIEEEKKKKDKKI